MVVPRAEVFALLIDGGRKRTPDCLQGGVYRAHSVVDAVVVSLQGVGQRVKQLGSSPTGSDCLVIA
jgi:hypothetical protein